MFVNLFPSLRAGDRARMTALLLIFLVLAGAALTSDLPPDGDDVSYITLAQALASGRGYVNLLSPGEPPERQYPPLFPLLLTPIVSVFGPSLLLLKLIPALAGGLALIAVFALLRPRLGADRALLIAALTGGNGYFLAMSTQVMSETTYLALSAAALILVHRAATEGGTRTAAFAGAVIAVAFYTRIIGVPLALGACGTLLIRRRMREALILAAVALTLTAPWFWRSVVLQNPYMYHLFSLPVPGTKGQAGPLLYVSRLFYNAPRYAGKVTADLFFHPLLTDVTPYHPLKIGLSLILTAGIVVGYIAAIKEAVTCHVLRVTTHHSPLTTHHSPLTTHNVDCGLLYLLFYLGFCLVWTYHDARFLVPVLPFLFEHVLRGAEEVGRRLRLERAVRPTASLLMAVGLAGCVSLVYGNHAHFYKDEMVRYREACLWVREKTPSDAVILCRKPREAAFWSGRKAWWYTGAQPAKEVLATAQRMGATHLLINDFPIIGVNLAERFSAVMREEGAHFRLVHETETPRVLIYEIH